MRALRGGNVLLLVTLVLVILTKASPVLGQLRGRASQILAEVTAQLADEERFRNVTVEVADDFAGIVSLRGTVALLEDKRRAAQKVQEANDMRVVLNHIQVETERIDDGLLLQQLRERLVEEQSSHIKLKVKKGIVTIRGDVRHVSQREQVLSSIAGVPGVIAMKDRLQIVAD